MPNLTLSVPEELYRRMKKHSDVKWSEVARKAVAAHLEKIEHEEEGILTTNELNLLLKRRGLNLGRIPLQKAIRYYEEMRRAEWRRTYTTRAPS